MASLTFKIDAKGFTAEMRKALAELKNPEFLLRPLMFDLIDLMKKRIHLDGKDANGGQIGTYSDGYLKYRQEVHKRKADKKVILSLTSKLESEWIPVATSKGYGIGFVSPDSYQKTKWLEENYDRQIFTALTKQESNYVNEFIKDKVNEILDKL